MDGKARQKKAENPRVTANPLSVLTFAWTWKTFWLGYQRDLEANDLYDPLEEHTSNILGDQITTSWNEETAKKHTPSLLRVLIKCFGPRVMLYGIFAAIIGIGQRVSQPIFLYYLLEYFQPNSTTSKWEAFWYAIGVTGCAAIRVLWFHPYMMAILHEAMKIRVACCTLIYRKALRLSRTALGKTTMGQAVNLLSNDVSRFDVALNFLHYLWIGPLETIIVTCIMYTYIGMSAVLGVVAVLLFIPLQVFLGQQASHLRLKTAIRTDERVRMISEMVTGMQAIKMYTWEYPFSDLIDKLRRKEVTCVRSSSYIRGITLSYVMFSTRLYIFLTLLAFALQDSEFSQALVFMVILQYSCLQDTISVFFPLAITQYAEVMVSIRRLQDFMTLEEVSNKDEKNEIHKETGLISIKEGSACWFNENTLSNINLHIKPGSLIAIVGQVGSGKTSLLNVMLKELELASGSLKVDGKIAYASQEPWLFAGSIRQNILFGRDMDPKRYDKVVKVCQLRRDFNLLPYGDKTVVGERGVSLSGGQRARINLARAVYSNSSICLFDDPLSAIDGDVGKRMFDECIVKYLAGKTRVLVTHQLQFLKNVDRVVVLKNGAIEAEETFTELSRRGIDFGQLLSNIEIEDKDETFDSKRRVSQEKFSSLNSIDSSNVAPDDPREIEELRTVGKIGFSVFAKYLKAGGHFCTVGFVLLLCGVAQGFASGGDYFVKYWADQEDRITHREYYISVFTVIVALTIFISLLRSFLFFNVCMHASIRLHDVMFRSISRAAMHFFDTNTSGRILNRFSKDMGNIDELLPFTLIDCVQIAMALAGIVVLVCKTNPYFLIPVVVIGLMFFYLRVVYIATSRSVKRLEGVTRSPVFAHLNATLRGLVTIRASGADEILIREFDHHQDSHSSAWYMFLASSRAFGFCLDFICVALVAVVTLSFVLFRGDATGGDIGLGITQSIGLMGMFQWGMRQSAELVNYMTSVERVLEFSQVETEAALTSSPEKRPATNWPQAGKIVFKDVNLRYSPSESPVLRNLNFVIRPREKVGIVGRTGAGKSSLVSALFRLAPIEGLVELDNVATEEIGLHDLRSKISIIPQEPFLFTGTLRQNLDPFDSYSDNELWRALEEVELKHLGLDGPVLEGGGNLSVGQRQLVCLARAIVRKNRVLVLDEATANVDLRTDELIQTTIRRKFTSCTVLTIAHRLNTVMDSDRILVMDAGRVVEFDHPYVLLRKDTGFLKAMVRGTGESMAERLVEIARSSFFRLGRN